MLTPYKIGNDIVDFSEPELQEKYKDARFLNRVFSDQEKSEILKSKNKAQKLWAFWAAKEAAFKACQKENQNIIFSPKNFEVRRSLGGTRDDGAAPLSGTLYHHHQRLDLLWTHPSAHLIHCIAVLSLNNDTFTRWNEIHTLIKKMASIKNHPTNYAQQSKSAREELIAFLERKIKPQKSLRIIRPETLINGRLKKAPPILLDGETVLRNHDISLSHDKEWIAAIVGSAYVPQYLDFKKSSRVMITSK